MISTLCWLKFSWLTSEFVKSFWFASPAGHAPNGRVVRKRHRRRLVVDEDVSATVAAWIHRDAVRNRLERVAADRVADGDDRVRGRVRSARPLATSPSAPATCCSRRPSSPPDATLATAAAAIAPAAIVTAIDRACSEHQHPSLPRCGADATTRTRSTEEESPAVRAGPRLTDVAGDLAPLRTSMARRIREHA